MSHFPILRLEDFKFSSLAKEELVDVEPFELELNIKNESGAQDKPIHESQNIVKDESPDQKELTRTRGKGKDWILLAIFKERREVVPYLNKRLWAVSSKTTGNDANKTYYRCRISKSCECCRCLSFPAYNTTFEIYETGEHVHEQINPVRGLSEETKELIQTLIKDKISTPKQIQFALRNQNWDPLPTLAQITNYKASYMRKLY